MPIEYLKSEAVFRDVVVVDETEGLIEWLQKAPAAKADLSACEHLHPANVQVLMAAGTRISAWPTDVQLCAWLKTALRPE